jgi:hypothetical protein
MSKVYEARIRRMAKRQGLQLQKSRHRDPLARGFGKYWLVDENEVLIVGEKYGLTLEQAETWLLQPKTDVNRETMLEQANDWPDARHDRVVS